MNFKNTILDGKQQIHFIGIGGSGMYPLAQILHAQGFHLTGSDNNPTDTVQKVRDMGIKVTIGQTADNIIGADLIVATAAILPDNPELIAAKASGVPMLERSELLGILTAQFENAICVTGTHGKTTATSMITHMLLGADADPSVFVGGKLTAIGGSGRVGASPHFVCESCEFCDHYLHLCPDIALILNIDEDHMEYFKTLDNLIASFHKFASLSTKLVVYNGDDENTCRAMAGIDLPTITFGQSDKNDYYPANITPQGGVHTRFDLMHRDEKLTTLDLYVPGMHNILNAVAAAACAIASGVDASTLATGLADFRGAGRRFEVTYHDHGITLVDDYAHHPAEIAVTLHAAKSLGYRRVIAVHQPFTYSRTLRLLDDFAKVLQIADITVLSEIMGSREVNTLGVYAKDLSDKIPDCQWFTTFEEIADHVCSIAEEGDIIITMSCGDINKCNAMMATRFATMHKEG